VQEDSGEAKGKTLGELYKENRQLEMKVKKYIEADNVKRLEARLVKMRDTLEIGEKPSQYTGVKLKQLLSEAGEKTTGSKAELFDRYTKYLESKQQKDLNPAAEVVPVAPEEPALAVAVAQPEEVTPPSS
jgi:hypothetical protein